MAVYTSVSSSELSVFLESFALGTCRQFSAIAEGIENSNYLVETETGKYILTLFEKRVNSDELPFFLSLMQHLQAQGFPAPCPIANKKGDILHHLKGKYCCLTQFLTGTATTAPTPDHCHSLGQTLAEFHQKTASFPTMRANSLSLTAWRPLWEKTTPYVTNFIPTLEETIEQRLSLLEQTWPQDLPTGIIHADAFPDNIFFDGSRVSGVIDFYFACTDAYAYELAICLNCWCYLSFTDFSPAHATALLQGYQSIRPLSHVEKQALPTLTEGAALRFLLTRLYDWFTTPEDALVTPKDPREYWHKMQHAPKINFKELFNESC